MIVQSLVNTTGGRLCAPACRYCAAHSTATRFGAVDSNRSPGSRAGQANGQTHNHRHWCSVTEKDRKQRSSSAEFDWAAVTNVSRVKSKHSAELPTEINKNAEVVKAMRERAHTPMRERAHPPAQHRDRPAQHSCRGSAAQLPIRWRSVIAELTSPRPILSTSLLN